MDSKKCTKCGEIKPIDYFYLIKDGNGRYRNDCIECHRKSRKIYNEVNSQRRKDYMVKYRAENPDVYKIWIEKNREHYLEGVKKWKIENPEKNKTHKKNNFKRNYQSNPKFRLKNNIRRLIQLSLSKNGYSKNSKTNDILGIDYDGFIKHIESQFTDGMTWDNKREWEIDHIIPISLGKTEEDIIRLNHYTNLRPLWGKDNNIKSNHVFEEHRHLIDKYIY